MGGTPLTIRGSSFQSGATVAFDGITADSVVVVSDTVITAVTSAHPADTVDVIVTNPNGLADTLFSGFEFIAVPPVVSSIDPISGTKLGGTPVTIRGINFKIGVTVGFDDSSATNVVVVSDSIITAATPAHPSDTVDVIVTNPDSLADTLFNGYTFLNAIPLANAGLDQIVNANAEVALDGSGSSDADGDSLSFNWMQIGGTAVSLSSATAQRPTFLAPAMDFAEIFSFKLTVDDGLDASLPDTVNVVVEGTGPPPPVLTPAGLNALGGDSEIHLSWSPNTQGIFDRFIVYRSTTSGFVPTPSDSIAGSTTNIYTDAPLSNGTKYYYRVAALDSLGGRSGLSDEADATPLGFTYGDDFADLDDWIIGEGSWTTGSALGSSTGNATLWNRLSFAGDTRVRFQANTVAPDSSNINVIIYGNGSSANSGYKFIFGGDGNTSTKIQRLGFTLAERNDLRIVPGVAYNIQVEKVGSTLRFYINDKLVLEDTDHSPLVETRVALNTFASHVQFNNIQIAGDIGTVIVYPFFDDMERGPRTWMPGGTWAQTTEDAHSGSVSWTDSPGTSYATNASVTLTLPMTLVGASRPELSFWHKYSLEQATSGNQGDFGYVRISSDAGAKFFSYYTITGASDWVQEKIDLTPWRGREILVQFWLWTDSDATVGDGWHIDDVSVGETETPPLGGLPFFDDANDDTTTNMYWQSSTFELIESGSFDGSQYWHSSPRTQNHSGPAVYRTFARTTLANEIDLNGTINPQLVFWHSVNRYGATYYVQISQDGGLNWSTLFSTTTSTGWTQKQLNLSGYINQKIRIRFYVSNSYYTDRWLVDNVRIREAPVDVVLQPPALMLPVDLGRHNFQLTWSKTQDPKFLRYDVRRNTTSSVSRSSSLVFSSADPSDTSFVDIPSVSGTYYYRVFSEDSTNVLSIGSNTVSGTNTSADVSSYPFYDGMEAGSGNWNWDLPWGVSEGAAYTDSLGWSDSPGKFYEPNASKTLTLPINLQGSNKPELSFWHKYSLEQATPSNQGDFVYVRISSDGGANFYPYYTETGSSDWVHEKIDLTPWRGLVVLVQFWLWADGDAAVGDGWFIDNIRIDETTTGPLGGIPFFDDVNDDTTTNMYWQSSTFELIEGGSFDGSQYWHSSPRTQNHSGSSVYRTFARITLANEIDLTGTRNPQLVFWHSINRYGATYYVQISQDNGVNWSTLFSSTTSTGWTQQQLNLSGYINQQVRIRFYVSNSYYTDRWIVDNIWVREAPVDVVLQDPTEIDRHSLRMTWSKSPDPKFLRYEVRRNTSSSVSRSNTLAFSSVDPSDTSFVDAVTVSGTNYYRVFVVDSTNVVSLGSNVVSGTNLLASQSSYPLYDGMEEGPFNWNWDLPWEVSSEAAYRDSLGWSDSPGRSYATNASKTLTLSMNLSLSNKPQLSFWHKYSLEQATPSNQGDFGYVRISSDAGANFYPYYTITGASDWVQEKIDLTPWRGREILVQFWLRADSDATVGNGWFIDDIRIDETTTGPLGGLPFLDDVNDDTTTNMYWQSSTFELIESGSHDGSQYWHSSPRTQNHSGSGFYRTFARMTLANEIDLTGAQNPQLVFRHSINRYGATYYVQISQDGGLNWATLFSTTTSTAWAEKKLSLAGYINQKIRVRFYISNSYYTDRWLIDNIQVREDPAATAIVDFATVDFPNVASAAVGNPTGRI